MKIKLIKKKIFICLSIFICSNSFADNKCEDIFKNQILLRAELRAQNVLNEITDSLTNKDLDKIDLFNSNPQTEYELRQAILHTQAEYNKIRDLKLALLILKHKYHWSELFVLKLFVQMKVKIFTSIARNLYRPTLITAREFGQFFGGVWRAYIIKGSMSLKWIRWEFVERLFTEGKDQISNGAEQAEGMVNILSKITSPSREKLEEFRNSIRTVGNPLALENREKIEIVPYKLSQMINLSGMSYPQLSVNAILSLLYTHVKLAKQGIRYTYNSGEGGTLLHLALLDLKTNKEELASAVTRYSLDGGNKKISKYQQAEIERSVEKIIEDRDILFKEFTQEDLDKAQIIGQLGPALNGARTLDNRIDFAVLKKYAEQPTYAGTQFKLKQAAKKGSKVDGNKISPLASFIRKWQQGKTIDSPEISVEWENLESLAEAIIVTKMVTKKPVSLKFAIGNADEIYDMMMFLRDNNALPDSIQLDGASYIRAPGSGNALLTGNTSHNITSSVMIMDVILKKLVIRNMIYLEATGDIITPEEALMYKSLGADGVAAARLWMGMGLGCALVMKCATGMCYYGIASGDGGLFSNGLDPKIIGPKGAKAAHWWFIAYTNSELQSGADGSDLPYRIQNGYTNPNNSIRIRTQFSQKRLIDIFPYKEIIDELQNRISKNEIERILFEGNENFKTQNNNRNSDVQENQGTRDIINEVQNPN